MEKAHERKYTRSTRIERIPIHIEGIGVAEIVSLGFGGVYINTPRPLSEGSVFDLSLPLPDGEPVIQVRAKVVYVEQGKGMGVQFSDLKTRDAERIGVLLLMSR